MTAGSRDAEHTTHLGLGPCFRPKYANLFAVVGRPITSGRRAERRFLSVDHRLLLRYRSARLTLTAADLTSSMGKALLLLLVDWSNLRRTIPATTRSTDIDDDVCCAI